jgi:aryl-alcohol dehydrogenase-like predicted oxidoreductase
LAEEGRLKDRFLIARNLERAQTLQAFAESRKHTLLQLAFSWLAARPGVSSIIAGATKPEQIEANVAAVAWRLTPEELREIDELVPAE